MKEIFPYIRKNILTWDIAIEGLFDENLPEEMLLPGCWRPLEGAAVIVGFLDANDPDMLVRKFPCMLWCNPCMPPVSIIVSRKMWKKAKNE